MSFSHIAILQYPDSKLQSETKELIMENISSLPLTMTLRVQYPFQFVLNDAGSSKLWNIGMWDVLNSINLFWKVVMLTSLILVLFQCWSRWSSHLNSVNFNLIENIQRPKACSIPCWVGYFFTVLGSNAWREKKYTCGYWVWSSFWEERIFENGEKSACG